MKSSGFVLVMTLWMLALMSMAASFFALWTQQSIELARNSQIQAQAAIDEHSTQATLLFLLTTQRFTLAGMTTETPLSELGNPTEDHYSILPTGDEIRLDDRVYQGIGQARFALQDKAGLFNLTKVALTNHPEVNIPTAHLLGQFGVPAKQRGGLIAKLQDYVDQDNLHQLNGAEAKHYREKQRPPPTNRLLFHPVEAYKILGWDTVDALWQGEAWLHNTSMAFSGHITNINTAPLAVLKTIPYFNTEAAERIVAYRKKHAFISTSELEEVIGIKITSSDEVLYDLALGFFPSSYLRLCLWHEGATQMQRIDLQSSFNADGHKPWRTTAHITTPIFHAYQNVTPIAINAALFRKTLYSTP